MKFVKLFVIFHLNGSGCMKFVKLFVIFHLNGLELDACLQRA